MSYSTWEDFERAMRDKTSLVYQQNVSKKAILLVVHRIDSLGKCCMEIHGVYTDLNQLHVAHEHLSITVERLIGIELKLVSMNSHEAVAEIAPPAEHPAVKNNLLSINSPYELWDGE